MSDRREDSSSRRPGRYAAATDNAPRLSGRDTLRGGSPIALPDGSTRTMLEDGDTLIIRGRAHAEGYRAIGFGERAGTIQPAPGDG